MGSTPSRERATSISPSGCSFACWNRSKAARPRWPCCARRPRRVRCCSIRGRTRSALGCPAIHGIDAARSFGVAVDACLFVCSLGAGGADAESRLPHFCMRYQPEAPARDLAGTLGSCDGGRNLHAETEEPECPIYPELGKAEVSKTIGFRDGRLVADAAAFDRLRHLQGEDAYRWRSGIKHDCGKVMEFLAEDGRYRNGLGDLATLEDSYLYPMLKGSEVASLDAVAPTRWMLVTQRHPGEETGGIAERAPADLGVSPIARPVSGQTCEFHLSQAPAVLGLRSRGLYVRPLEGRRVRASQGAPIQGQRTGSRETGCIRRHLLFYCRLLCRRGRSSRPSAPLGLGRRLLQLSDLLGCEAPYHGRGARPAWFEEAGGRARRRETFCQFSCQARRVPD